MSARQDWKTIGLEILETHRMDCGDGSCGCGCFPFAVSTVDPSEKFGSPRNAVSLSPAPKRSPSE